MTTTIVDAGPQHASFLAWVELTAFRSHLERGLWDRFIDGDEAETLRFLEAFTTTSAQHWSHLSTFLVAEVDGSPAAALGGYLNDDLGDFSYLQAGVTEADEALGRTPEQTMAGWQRVATTILVGPEHEPGAWVVENVATSPTHRRQGLIHSLLNTVVARGRERGATQADVSVYIGNDSAQRAYEKAGFQVVAEKCHPDFEAVWDCPGIRTLSMPL